MIAESSGVSELIPVSLSPGPQTGSGPANPFHFAKTSNPVCSLLLAISTAAVYYPVRHYSFLNYDDEIYVTNNVHVKYGLDWDGVKWAFTTYAASNWHPLTWLSHALDCQLFGINSARHHDTNVLLHVLNVLLLFWILQRATGFTGRSLMVAALFALHPINVESVAWIAERKNLLSMLFFLLALGAYGWYARIRERTVSGCGAAVRPGTNGETSGDYFSLPSAALGLLAFAADVGRKKASISAMTTAGTIPPRSLSWLILEKLPLLALSAASAIVTVRAQRADYAMSNPLNTFPFAIRMGNAVLSYVQYLKKAFWPSGFSILYPHPGIL